MTATRWGNRVLELLFPVVLFCLPLSAVVSVEINRTCYFRSNPHNNLTNLLKLVNHNKKKTLAFFGVHQVVHSQDESTFSEYLRCQAKQSSKARLCFDFLGVVRWHRSQRPNANWDNIDLNVARFGNNPDVGLFFKLVNFFALDIWWGVIFLFLCQWRWCLVQWLQGRVLFGCGNPAISWQSLSVTPGLWHYYFLSTLSQYFLHRH